MKGDAYPRGQGEYRYWLWREWDADKPLCMFIMLNPSKADENPRNDKGDPTMRLCRDYAQCWGFGGLWVGNLYAFRSSKPRHLASVLDQKGCDYLIGAENDEALEYMQRKVQGNGTVIAAWGALTLPAKLRETAYRRESAVLSMLAESGTLCALKLTECGRPWHPRGLSIQYSQRWPSQFPPRRYFRNEKKLGDPCPTPAVCN